MIQITLGEGRIIFAGFIGKEPDIKGVIKNLCIILTLPEKAI
jgi:hypothetical protein